MNEKILATDVKNIVWVKSEYYVGGSSHEFTCEIDGKTLNVKHELYHHDDGYGFTIHTKPEDIWNRMDPVELEKLDATLWKERDFGSFLQQIQEASDLDMLDEVKWQLMETAYSAMRPTHWGLLNEAMEEKREKLEEKEKW